MKKLTNKLSRAIPKAIEYCLSPRNPKIFCVGRNRTGTTSLTRAFLDQGFFVGNQRKAERLAPFYHQRNFEPIVRYCRSARVFQDVPFSWPETYREMDRAFPDEKFILTIRDDPEQWYRSVINFSIKRYGRFPETVDLNNDPYVWRGWSWENFQARFPGHADDLFNKDLMLSEYLKHNQHVIEYFQEQPDKLLVINVAEKMAYGRLCDFLGVPPRQNSFPWENKTYESGPTSRQQQVMLI